MTEAMLNPYATDRLSPQHLQLLFPASFYKTDEELSMHMSESCLVEQMTWEGDTAVGETAFWLKVLSTPQTEYLRRQKRLFKLAIAERCRDISVTYAKPAADKPPSVIKLKVQENQPISPPVPQTHTNLATLEVKISKSGKEPTILIKPTVSQPDVVLPVTTENGKEPMIVDQMISDNDWELIEKHLAGDTTSNQVAAEDSEALTSLTPGFGIKTYKCRLCSFAADNRPALNKHQKLNHMDQLPFSCDLCDYTSKYAWSIKTHMDSVHLKTKRFQCSECNYATSQACFLRRHTLRVHNPNQGAHRCPYCDYTAHHPNSLQRHINRQHTQNFAHKCPYCEFGRDCKYLVEDHINDVHLKKVIYQCSECSFQTYKQRSLKSHHKTHLTRDVVQCSECDYKSVSVAGLTRHMKTEHPDADAKATLAGLKTQTFRPGSIKPDADDYTAVLMGKCKFCNFTTENVIRLKAHVRSAHKRKNLPCAHCDFKAANRKGLARHITNKHQDKLKSSNDVLLMEQNDAEPAADNSQSLENIQSDSADNISDSQLPLVAIQDADAVLVTVLSEHLQTPAPPE